MQEQSSKCCSQCDATKPLDQFFRDPRGRSGRQAICKACDTERAKVYRAAHLESIRAKDALYRATNLERIHTRKAAHYAAHRDEVRVAKAAQYAANREVHLARGRKWAAEWRAKNPELARLQHRVQMTALRAIKSGRLVRPDACEECGARGKPDAAHWDYSRPLDVRWLCRSCHVRWDCADPKLKRQ